ncbi:MAG: ChaN family lipoprotein [Gammaproteobacteria bacterium]|nr:ChaN family lipoprotein [Gammaproteobacteria bacterium]
MLASEFILLGERHDNLIHHRYQSWVIEQLSNANKKTGVAFEMINVQQGQLLARHKVRTVDEMIGLLNQFKTHWYYEQRYRNLFAATLQAGFPVIPANLSRKQLRQLSTKGENGLPKAYRKMLEQVPLSSLQTQSLEKEIMASHCNMLSNKIASKLVLSQRIRDAVMAHGLSKIHSPVKVLIAGAGHVRKDRGVPLYLMKYKPQARVLSLGFTEVENSSHKIADYTRRWAAEELPFDYVWFTPQVKRKDLCAEFARQMKNKHRTQN